jgi:cytochrome c553
MRRSQTHLLLACFSILFLPVSAPASSPILETCAECHGVDGMGQGLAMVPLIAGIPAEHIEDAILSYVDGVRRCTHEPRMCETVASLSESEVAEVAEYYAGKTRGASAEESDGELAAQGERVYNEHCSACHVSPDSEEAAYAVGIPLHGQRADYLRYAIDAYISGDREVQFEAMGQELGELRPGDIDALVNFFSSYRPAD